MITELHSKGLYTTWINLPEINTAFDCGEGMASHLGNRCFGVRQIFLSHDHTDHTAGLIPFLGIRSVGFGEKNTPLNIYFPAGNRIIQEIRDFHDRVMPVPTYPLQWIPIHPGDEIPLPGFGKTPRAIRAFEVVHGTSPRGQTLGFSVLETRKSLLPEFQKLPPQEIEARRKAGETLTAPTKKKLLVYSGDAYRVPPSELEGAALLLHDCTFLNPADRDKESISHATLGEVVQAAKEANIKKVLGIHISPRYKKEDIAEAQHHLNREKTGVTLVPPYRPFTYFKEAADQKQEIH